MAKLPFVSCLRFPGHKRESHSHQHACFACYIILISGLYRPCRSSLAPVATVMSTNCGAHAVHTLLLCTRVNPISMFSTLLSSCQARPLQTLQSDTTFLCGVFCVLFCLCCDKEFKMWCQSILAKCWLPMYMASTPNRFWTGLWRRLHDVLKSRQRDSPGIQTRPCKITQLQTSATWSWIVSCLNFRLLSTPVNAIMRISTQQIGKSRRAASVICWNHLSWFCTLWTMRRIRT